MLFCYAPYPLAQKYLPKGPGSIFTFGIKGGSKAEVKFIENLKIFSHLANVADAKSLVMHSSSTTHSQLSEADQRASGVTYDKTFNRHRGCGRSDLGFGSSIMKGGIIDAC
jgi:O-acetylhomoserine/O-acetylserine sulfhydrylase-like pyridoxal-dependent enzyme